MTAENDFIKRLYVDIHPVISLAHDLVPKKVIFNNPATIVYWEDGSKTVVKCGPDDIYDHEKGFAMCVLKRLYGDKFHAILKKHVHQEETKEDSQEKVDNQTVFEEAVSNISNHLLACSKEQKIKPMNFQSKRNLWNESFIFDNRKDAERVLQTLRDFIELYGFASVSDLYDAVNIDYTFEDTKRGWYDLSTASIINRADCYSLNLPYPINLN